MAKHTTKPPWIDTKLSLTLTHAHNHDLLVQGKLAQYENDISLRQNSWYPIRQNTESESPQPHNHASAARARLTIRTVPPQVTGWG